MRGGDIEGLLAVLDSEVVVRFDEVAAGPGAPREIRGAETWSKRTVALSPMFKSVEPVLIDGVVGLVWAPRGPLVRVLRLAFTGGKLLRSM